MLLAERAGFEPAVGDYPTHAFQPSDFLTSKACVGKSFMLVYYQQKTPLGTIWEQLNYGDL